VIDSLGVIIGELCVKMEIFQSHLLIIHAFLE